MAMPHFALEVVGAAGAVLVIATGGLMSLGEVTPNPVSRNWLATAHSEVEVKTWVFKTAIVLSANILTGSAQIQSIVILIAAGWIVYVHIRYVSRVRNPVWVYSVGAEGRSRELAEHAQGVCNCWLPSPVASLPHTHQQQTGP